MKKTIRERIERKNNFILEQPSINVYLNFDDKATDDMLKKEYLEMKDFKIVKENNLYLGKKTMRSENDILDKLANNVKKSNNSAKYIINRKDKKINIIVDKILLSDKKLNSIENISNIFGLENLFDGPIKKNEKILNLKKMEVKSYSFRISEILIPLF